MPHQRPPSLILHADDLGLNAAVTEGIIEAFSSGLLTSTSLLTNAPAAEFAVQRWRSLELAHHAGDLPSSAARRRLGDPRTPFDLGVHLNLTQGLPRTAGAFPDELRDTSGNFLSPGRLYCRLRSHGRRWRGAVHGELRAQINWLLDRGLTPTHLNGHQYVEMMPVVSDIITDLAQRHRLPYVRAAVEPGHWHGSQLPGWRLANWCLSHVKQYYARRLAARLDRLGIRHADAFFGTSHAGRIDLAIVRHFVHSARRRSLTEIAFHPGQPPPAEAPRDEVAAWRDVLAAARPAELALLCSSDLADLLATRGFQLARILRHAAGGDACREKKTAFSGIADRQPI